MKRYLFLLLTFILVSCSEKRVTADQLEYYYVKNISIDKETGKPYTGWVYNNYKDSNILATEFYCKDGYIEGYMTSYYKDGTVKSKSYHVKGDSTESHYYDPDGNEITFKEFLDKGYLSY